jgi:TolA-binding protein
MADAGPLSWKQGGQVPAGQEEAARVVKLAAQLEPRPIDYRSGWDDVVDRHAHRHSSVTQVLAFAAAAACGALLVWAAVTLRPPREAPVARLVEPPPAPRQVAVAPAALDLSAVEPGEERVGRAETVAPEQSFTASPGSQWTKGRSGVIRLEAGHFEAKASPQLPQRLQTPEVTVVATQARFATDVTEQGTTVAVFEGTAEVSTARAKATLHAGQTRHWGAEPQPPREIEVQPIDFGTVAIADGTCRHVESLGLRLTCLATEAKGGDLKAQAAVFQQAELLTEAHRPAGAAEALRDSLRRFPDGVLAPEVQLSLMRLLAEQQDYDGAIEAGSAFLKSNPDDPRVEEVQGFVSRLGWLRAR